MANLAKMDWCVGLGLVACRVATLLHLLSTCVRDIVAKK